MHNKKTAMLNSKINYFSFLFLVIIYPYQIVVGVKLSTPNQFECYNQIREVFLVDENPSYRKTMHEFAISHLRYVGPDPSVVGTFCKYIKKGSVKALVPYMLYNDLNFTIIDNAYPVRYYDKIFNYINAEDILTPEAFCEYKDNGNLLGMKSFCLYELSQVGFNEKAHEVPINDYQQFIDKMQIAQYAFTNKVLSDFPEDEYHYTKDYLMNVATKVKTKRYMLWPDEFCKAYA